MSADILIKIDNLKKTFQGGLEALKGVNLEIQRGEILALLGPNGAGKTTLINAICGIVLPTSGTISVDGYDVVKDFRKTRSMIGLVPQELHLEAFEKVFQNVSYTRGLYELSGGMKKRALIAKALSHEPKILFLDEPTAGVDINLRRDMWRAVKELKENGVTIILTTHYIEEAEAISDRVSVINNGEIIITDNKNDLMQKMGQKNLTIEFQEPFSQIPSTLESYNLKMNSNNSLTYSYDSHGSSTGITALLQDIKTAGLKLKDLNSSQTSLETIFEKLLEESV